MMRDQLKQCAYLMRLHKPIGIFLLLWPTLWALWLASAGKPNVIIVVIFILGVILMRSAGCVINDIADRNIDGRVERTRLRPLATGKVSVREALVLFFILIFAAFLLVLLLNTFTILLAFVGAALTVFYPLMKRFTHLPQVGLGVAFAWSVPMAFAAEINSIPASAWLVFVIAVIWPVIYDTMYAMVDRRDDLKIGVKSTAILFGSHDKFIIGLLQSIILLLFVLLGYFFQLNLYYYCSVIVAALLFSYQQWLIKDREPQKCFAAFLNNHWVGLSVFTGIFLSYENCC